MENVASTEKFTHLSLCSGYDGIGLGLKGAGFDIGLTVHVEVEAFASYNLVKKIEAGVLGEGVIWPDLKTFPYERFRGCFDILSGGFPCQPFSAAGKQLGDEDPRHLFPFIKKGIEECRPSLVVLENVDGISSTKLKGDHWNDPAGTPVLLHVLRELERVGYNTTAVPVSASEVGAPHQRNRWFIIGVADCDNQRPQRTDRGGAAGTQGEPSGYVTECDSSMANKQCKGLEGYAGDGNGSSESGWQPEEANGSTRQSGLQRVLLADECPECECCGEPFCEKCNDHYADCQCIGPTEEESEVEYVEIEGVLYGRRRREGSSHIWPSRPGEDQFEWEPPRVVRQSKPPMGGNTNGSSGGMGYADLCESCDNRTDELRLLGNGVVPQSCADAVLRGLQELLG